MTLRYFHIVCISVLLSSCHTNNSNNTITPGRNPEIATPLHSATQNIQQQFTFGKVNASLHCLTDTSLSYSLYVPKLTDSTKKLPLIYFFDPEGAGALPLNLYRQLADKYGYILIGSNNSKNGLPPNRAEYIAQTLINDTKGKFNSNKQLLYVAGFSGGARVAVSAALSNSAIIGVAGAGAGFPNLNKPIDPKFLYISFAGNRDFNLTELKNLNEQLNTLALRHFLIEFDGKHEWPPAAIFENAFFAFEFNAIQKGLIPKKEQLITRFIQHNDSALQQYKLKNKLYELYMGYKKILFFLGSLADVKSYYAELLNLQNTASLKKILEEKKALADQERELQESYNAALLNKDLSWWLATLKEMNTQPATEKGLMYKRLQSYLGLVVYLQAKNSLTQNNMTEANRFLTLYKLLEPKNKEQAYLFAVFYARNGVPEKALHALTEAEELGFTDVTRLTEDESFIDLKQNNLFIEIIARLYAKTKK